jgi:molybdopterin-guanine dinucleotide biosynthesis protein
MLVLGVGGCCSGVGKTALVCRLLEALGGWGALKVSPAHRDPRRPGSIRLVGHGLDGAYRIDTDPGDPGSDTGRFHAAGAARVCWLRSTPGRLGPGLDEALAAFASLPGVIVEGNAPARERPPDGLILLARVGQREVKDSARALLPRADWVVLNRSVDRVSLPDSGRAPEVERALGRRPTFVIDAAAADDSGTAEFLAAVRAWARR